ncbi:MAG: hypothetical protein SFV17_11735 [Candidatus Obscuribacter sp.]|nr:hypothetical protein [Candidatus Melainabacteria bacterium]MDX1987349.1 hypothetical protein [Candidatus Obscuribacter sp.]
MTSVEDKKKNFATIVDGKVVDDSERVAVCIKGSVLGFPATIEAIKPDFPFGTSFYLETDVLHEHQGTKPSFTIVVTPKVAKGLSGFLGRLLLIDAHERPTGIKVFDSELLAHSEDLDICHRFIGYPGMAEKLRDLQRFNGFREFHIQGGKGLCLICPTNFKGLSYDVARETLQVMATIAQVLFEF